MDPAALRAARARLSAVAPPAEAGPGAAGLNRGPQEWKDYQRYMQKFNMEVWLQALGDCTFRTELQPLTQRDAEALVACYEGRGEEGLDDMALRLEQAMLRTDPDFAARGVFVKTSCRSAKDYAEQSRLREAYKKGLQGKPDPSENDKLVAMSKASMELLRMRSARAVLEVFSKSERVYNDMQLALSNKEAQWEEHFCVREWVELEPDMEFRAFVFGGRLTAVSQYRHLVFFPRLPALLPRVREELQSSFSCTVQPRLKNLFPGDNYVVDFGLQEEPAVAGSSEEAFALRKIWVVEVNPFYETTDGALFSWSKDRQLLEGREEAAEAVFRVRERPAKGASALVYGRWKELLREQ